MKELLKHLSIFSDFNETDLNKLAEICILKKYDKDELLFYEGERSEYLHLLIKGSLKIYKSTPKGNEVVLHRLNPVNFIAEIVNFEDIPYPASARFLSKSEVLKIDYQRLKAEFFTNTDFVTKLLSSLAKKILVMNEFIHSQMILNAEAKLAKLIIEHSELFTTMKHNQLASLINMAPETFSRLLAKFKSDGAIASEGKKIIILNHDYLNDQFN